MSARDRSVCGDFVSATDGSGRRRSPPERAISTVFDVAVFLLLVSVAVALLLAATDPGSDRDADVAAEAATTLATTTTTVEYDPAVGESDLQERTDRGTVAGLLATATVANAELDGESIAETSAYEDAVRDATRGALSDLEGDVAYQIRTHWKPLPDAGLEGSMTVGESPPADADIHAATLSVPVGTADRRGVDVVGWSEQAGGWSDTAETTDSIAESMDHTEAAADTAAAAPPAAGSSVVPPGGTAARTVTTAVCADAVEAARTFVGASFPPDRTDVALRAGGAVAAEVLERYESAANRLDLESIAPSDEGARSANAYVLDGLVDALADACGEAGSPIADERAGTDDADGAGRADDPVTVTVVVRTWSP